MSIECSICHAEDGDGELPTPVPWCSGLLAPRTPPTLSVNIHVCAPPTYYESKGEGRSCRHLSRIRMNGRRCRRPTRRRSRRGRGKESRWAGSASDDHHIACSRHVRHTVPSAFPESSSVYVSECCIHPCSLARHDCS
jgi:hypothetical protein